jgi:aldose 1-epimerase
VVEIESPGGSARAVVLPEYGGRLHQLLVTAGGREHALLWSPEDPAEYGERPTRGGSFPMAPWPNRVAKGRFTWRGREYDVPTDGKPHAIHGRVMQRPWEVVQATRTSCDLRCELDEGWPWPGWVTQWFEMGDGWLRMELGVHAELEAFPAGCGWHPWFRRDVGEGDVRVRVPGMKRYVMTENVPTGEIVRVEGESDLREGPALRERRLDDCYRAIEGPIEIHWGGLTLTMEIDCEAPHVQVFTPEYAFCVEPETCAPDAFNLDVRGVEGTGMAVAEPGKPVRIGCMWAWRQ